MLAREAHILGLATRIIAVLFAAILIGAILMVKLSLGFLSGYELDVALLTMSVALFLIGSRLFAVDSLFFKRRPAATA